MDTTPPQAPPALTQSTYQEAASAYDRLVAMQAWLAREQAEIPSLPDTVEAGALAPYLAQLDTFWRSTPTSTSDGSSRRMALSQLVAAAALDLARLAHDDGNLDDDSLALIRDTVSTGSNTLPAHISVRQPMFGDTAYAGTMLLQDTRTTQRVLLFSAYAGWESFPTVADAHAGIEQRARRALASTANLPGIARQHLLGIGADAFVSSQEIADPPFESFVERTIEAQGEKLRQAWFESALARKADPAAAVPADRAWDALGLNQFLDVTTLLAVRDAALTKAFNATRLARVPGRIADNWREAEETYESTRAAVLAHEMSAGLGKVASLSEYAMHAMGERLKALGIDRDPSQIQVRVDRTGDPAVRLESLQSLFEGPAPATMRLIDLAYQNVAIFDPVRLTAINDDGTAIAGLDDTALRQIVRDLDLSARYRSYVESTFRSGTDASMRREHATSLQWTHMALQAIEARLSYYLDDAPRSFRPDRADRGYRWVRAALDAPVAANRARVEGHEIVVHQVTYLGTPLRDILQFGVRQPGSVPSIVLYTPDAPDGVTFREFDDRAQAARQFFYHPAFREYLLDRLPAEYARVLPNGASREFAGDHLAHWILGASSSAAYTRTAARFEEREVTGDFLDAAYEIDVQLGLRNAQTYTRSASEANWTWLLDGPRSLMADQVVANALQGVVTAPARAAQAAWRIYDNVKAGDHAQAFVDFADFYNASLAAVAPAYLLSSAPMARGIVGARFRVGGRIVEARPAVQPSVVFESRFAAKGVRKSGQANQEGIYAIDGGTYIEQGGQLYAVRYDIDYGTWRLTRPNAGNAFRGPAIQRTASGKWSYNRVGLRGGNPPDELFNEYVDEFEQAFPDPFERDLVRAQMQRELTDNVAAIDVTAAQRAHWNAALERAHHRSLANAQAQPPFANDFPYSYVVPRIPTPQHVPAGYRPVAAAEVPDTLYYYGEKPFKYSMLEREYIRGGITNPNWAAIRTELLDRQVNGIRLTTVPPTATMDRIRAATGYRGARGQTFVVAIRPRHMLTVTERDAVPQASLIVREGAAPGTYIMRAPAGMNRVKFYGEQHQVMSSLPIANP